MQLKELLEKRSGLITDLEAMIAKLDEEKRSFTDEEKTAYDAKEAEVKSVDNEIALAERRSRLDYHKKKTSEPLESRSLTGRINELPDENRKEKPVIHATAVQHRNLKGFKGPKANEDAYKSGRWLFATVFGHQESRSWCQDHGIETRVMSSNNNFLGGAVVPQEFSRSIIDLREEYGVFRANSKVVPMASDSMIVPRRDGGLTAYFVKDNDEITASDKAWSQVEMTARKIAALAKWSNELNEDAIIAIADDLASEIAYAFATKEDQCGFLGDGTSTYGGITGVIPKINDGSHAASIYTTLTGNTSFATLDIADFVGATSLLPEFASMNAKWYISKAGFASSMQNLAYSAGGNTVTNIGGGMGLSFLGYPVVISQVLNSTLTTQTGTVIALFGDLSLATTFGDRSGVRVDASRDRYFENDQLAIRGTERFDIVAHSTGTNSVAGPMIAIKTAGS
jgi:HK97 family phage major capsid protein